jgi:hypothetical protein
METALRYLTVALEYVTAAVLSLTLGSVRLIFCR